MIGDMMTVMWKEGKEIFFQRGSLRGGTLGLILLPIVFGILLPLQMGRSWVESPTMMLYWGWVPLFLVNNVIADSFAGERERHTLETLLASRLSDRAILFGKIGAGILYGWGLTMVSMLLGLATVNIANWKGQLLIFPAGIGLGIVGLSLLVSGLAAGAGVLISLRASTVRQAQQTLGVAVMLLLFVPIFGIRALPDEFRVGLAQMLAGADVTTVVLIILVVLAALDAILLLAAMARFRRARLILD